MDDRSAKFLGITKFDIQDSLFQAFCLFELNFPPFKRLFQDLVNIRYLVWCLIRTNQRWQVKFMNDIKFYSQIGKHQTLHRNQPWQRIIYCCMKMSISKNLQLSETLYAHPWKQRSKTNASLEIEAKFLQGNQKNFKRKGQDPQTVYSEIHPLELQFEVCFLMSSNFQAGNFCGTLFFSILTILY